MTKKDYILIAGAISRIWKLREEYINEPFAFAAGLNGVINELEQVLRRDNPHFDNVKFWEACHATTE